MSDLYRVERRRNELYGWWASPSSTDRNLTSDQAHARAGYLRKNHWLCRIVLQSVTDRDTGGHDGG